MTRVFLGLLFRLVVGFFCCCIFVFLLLVFVFLFLFFVACLACLVQNPATRVEMLLLSRFFDAAGDGFVFLFGCFAYYYIIILLLKKEKKNVFLKITYFSAF